MKRIISVTLLAIFGTTLLVGCASEVASGTNPRPMTCIMYTTSLSITNADIICSECQQDIRNHLAKHH